MLKNWPLILLFYSAMVCADSGSIARNTDLKDKPYLDAATTAKLSANSKVDILKRQGAWMQIKTSTGKVGWVKLLNIRSGSNTSGHALGGIGNLVSVAKTGSSGNTVTTGVKGLSEESIKNAKPSPRELARLEQLGVSKAEAQRYAAQTGLTAQRVASIAIDR